MKTSLTPSKDKIIVGIKANKKHSPPEIINPHLIAFLLSILSLFPNSLCKPTNASNGSKNSTITKVVDTALNLL